MNSVPRDEGAGGTAGEAAGRIAQPENSTTVASVTKARVAKRLVVDRIVIG